MLLFLAKPLDKHGITPVHIAYPPLSALTKRTNLISVLSPRFPLLIYHISLYQKSNWTPDYTFPLLTDLSFA